MMQKPRIFPRKRIDDLLGHALEVPLCTVTAHAGSGKTTATESFCSSIDVPSRWVTVTSGDDDALWEKLCDAAEALSPDAAVALRIIGVPYSEHQQAQALSILRRYENTEALLVVDDCQFLADSSPFHSLCNMWAAETFPCFHLVLLARSDPPIALTSLQVKGLCFRIDTQDLMFTRQEVAGYLAARGLKLSDAEIDRIAERSTGWIAALYLLSEGLIHGRQDKGMEGINALFEENLLNDLAPFDCEMLVRLSDLDGFTPDLAVAALDDERARGLISRMLAENAFIACNDQGICMLHPLLQSCLSLRRSDDQRQKQVRKRAGLWLLDHPDYTYPHMIDLFERGECVDVLFERMNDPRARWLRQTNAAALYRVASQLPEDRCLAYPFAYLQVVFFALLSPQPTCRAFGMKQLGIMWDCFSQADDPQGRRIHGELIVIRRVFGFGDDVEKGHDPLNDAAILLDGQASLVLKPHHPFTFGLPMLSYSEFMASGKLDEAVDRCQHNRYELVTDGFGRGSDRLMLAEAALLRCEMDDAAAFARQAIAAAEGKQQDCIAGCARFVLMRRALFLGDLTAAARQMAALHALLEANARVQDREGIAFATVRQLVLLADAFYEIQRGCLGRVPASLFDELPEKALLGGMGVPLAVGARARFLEGDNVRAEALCAAIGDLSSVGQTVRLSGMVTQAVALEQMNGMDNGIRLLEEALIQAEQDGIVLVFAEHPDIVPLIERVARRHTVDADFLARVAQAAKTCWHPDAAGTPVPVALSDRELEVLRYAADGYSRREIAQMICVQEDTVKSHLSKVYRKLHVSNKIEAINVARDNGII